MTKRYVCFYCGGPILGARRERDHFPLPDRHGGTVTVDACLPCHDAKDRLSFSEWPEEWVAGIVRDFPTLSRETRLFLGKTFALLADMIAERDRRG